MHELSIAMSMVDEIEAQARKHGGGVVEAVFVRIGVLSGVDIEALRFAYEVACQDTSLENSRLEIESVGLLVFCPECATEHRPDPQHIQCPRCITPVQKILEGRELEVKALELTT